MSIFKLLFRSAAFISLVALMSPAAAKAEDLYFMTVYGAQRPIINLPQYTHTWATFVRLSGPGPDPRAYTAQAITISWMPATLVIRPLSLRPEKGVNLTLEKTVAWCEESRMEIAQFGPYQIKPELFNLAFRRYAVLESGEMTYLASDLFSAKWLGETTNCIYAVLDIDGRDPAFRPLTLGFGFIGSAFVARRLSQYIVDRNQTHSWVTEMIGAKYYRPVR